MKPSWRLSTVCSGLLALAFGLSSAALLPAQEKDGAAKADKPGKAIRMLFVTQSGGFKHGSVTRRNEKLAPAEEAMTQLGIKSGLFRADCTQDVVADFTKDNLQNYDLVMFYTTGGRKQLPIGEDALEYFLGTWLRQKGHGFIGAHSAADTYADYEPYWDMIGGSFNGHPWGSGETVTVTVHDQEHPISKPWGAEFVIKDEIYRFKNWQPDKVRVLMSLNMAKTRRKEPYHVPIAWCKEYGEGKAFHMSLGHNEAVWEDERYMQSMIGGIKWILGLEKGDAAPNPELSKAEEEKAKSDVAAAK